jgi:hypothetical protein
MLSLVQRGVAECLGTAFLLAGVVGSGIMAAKLADRNGALALLCNTLPTGAILTVLILTFGSISGAHFNPAVSIALALRRELSTSTAVIYIGAQVIGAIVGVVAAHAMFALPLWQVSMTVRTGPGLWLAEGVATFGLLLTIIGCGRGTPSAVPMLWASTSRRPIGSRHLLPSQIPPSRLPVRFPIPLLALHRTELSHLSRPNSQVCLWRRCSGVGCGPSSRQNDEIRPGRPVCRSRRDFWWSLQQPRSDARFL